MLCGNCTALQEELVGLESQREEAGALRARVAELTAATAQKHDLQVQLADMEAAAAEVRRHACL